LPHNRPPSQLRRALRAAPRPQPATVEPKVPLPAKLLVGGIAGVIGTSVIFPLDMVKTRMQNVRAQLTQSRLRARMRTRACACAHARLSRSARAGRRKDSACGRKRSRASN
jgi:hypothetical protein